MEKLPLFATRYTNYKITQIEKNEAMNRGIKREILRRISMEYLRAELGEITIDDLMGALSRNCCTEGEDLSAYAVEG